MVTRVVNEMNRSAREKHAEELGKSLVAFKKEGLETTAGSGDENVVAPSDRVVSLQNIDMKDSVRPKFTEADMAVSFRYY
jgi:hypothetical protein